MIVKFTLLFIVSFVVCNDDINIENIKKFMSQSPEDLAKTLQLLENPYIATALVNDNKKERKRISTNNYPIEESNNLLNFLLTKRLSDVDVTKQYKIEKPQFPLVPPTVDAKGIEKDPLLASFFLDTMEDQAPLEVSKIMLIYDDLFKMFVYYLGKG